MTVVPHDDGGAVELIGGQAARLVAWADAARAAHVLAQSLVRTNVCPPAFRNKPEEATAVILLGAELGLTPISSLRAMYEVKGQIGMTALAQVALVRRAGHRVWTESQSDDAVVVAGARRETPNDVERAEWTIERAHRAGLVRRGSSGSPSQYETQPRAMLWARAATDIARRIGSDVLLGLADVDVDEPNVENGPEPVRRSISRAARQPEPERVVEPSSSSAGGLDVRASIVLDEPEPVDDELVQDALMPEPAEPVLLNETQRARIMATLNARGIRNHDDRVRWLTQTLGRVVESTKTLTRDEATEVLDALDWGTGDDVDDV